MDWLLIGPWFSLNLSGAILSGVIAAYLLRVRPASAATRWLGVFFALYTAVLLSYEGPIVVYAPWAVYLDAVNTALQPFMAVALIQFAYHFPENRHPREARLALALSAAGAAGISIWVTATELTTGTVFAHHINKMSANEVDWQWWSRWNTLAPLWAVVVLVRHRARGLAIAAFCLSLQPVFDLVAFSLAPPGTFQVPLVVEALFSLFAVMLAFPILGLVYLNSTTDPTSFMAKVVGVALMAVLVLFPPLMEFAVVPALHAGYDRERLAEVAHVEALIAQSPGAPLAAAPPAVAYVTARALAGGTMSAEHRPLFARHPGFSLEAINREEEAQRAGGSVTGDVSSVPERQRGYRGRREPYDRHFVQYAVVRPEAVYEVGFSYRAMREQLHQTTRVLLGIELTAVALVLVVVPLFFRSNFTLPLRALLDGVRRVNAGDLTARVPVRREDEIGFLARSFNGMVESVGKAQHLLAAQAAELAARNAQLERLGALSPREREVAQLLAAGHTNREIAAELVITERTAAAHVEHILGKLQLRSRTQVATTITALNGHAQDVLLAKS